MAYTIVDKFSIDEILPLLSDRVDRKLRKPIVTKDGELFQVKVASLRLVTFKMKGLKCCYCGIEATHFNLEYTGVQNKPHFNMYSNDMIMTKEHLLPKSQGGKDHIDNMETCCYDCNCLRGNMILPSITDMVSEK